MFFIFPSISSASSIGSTVSVDVGKLRQLPSTVEELDSHEDTIKRPKLVQRFVMQGLYKGICRSFGICLRRDSTALGQYNSIAVFS